MKTRNFFTGLAVVLAVITSSGAVQAPEAGQTSARFVGTWKLISRMRMHDGKPLKDVEWHRHSIGYIMYDDSGHMAVQIMATERTGNMDCSKVPDAGTNNPSYCDGYGA